MCKLKTLEYRIFRKIREKLRHFYKDNKKTKTPESVVKAFEKEMKELMEGNELPQPFEFYVKLLNSAFQFIEKQPQMEEVLMKEYVTFEEQLLKYHAS